MNRDSVFTKTKSQVAVRKTKWVETTLRCRTSQKAIFWLKMRNQFQKTNLKFKWQKIQDQRLDRRLLVEFDKTKLAVRKHNLWLLIREEEVESAIEGQKSRCKSRGDWRTTIQVHIKIRRLKTKVLAHLLPAPQTVKDRAIWCQRGVVCNSTQRTNRARVGLSRDRRQLKQS